jgi:hypothetical protein
MNDINDIQAYSGNSLPARIIEQGGAIQRTGNDFITAVAVQRPRSIAEIANRVFDEARAAGTEFYYKWDVKLKSGRTAEVKGASISLAMSVFRNYMNCFVDVEFEDHPSKYLLTGVFVDLENGTTFKRKFSQRKRQNMGNKMSQDQERQEDITFQIAQSKAIRNVVLAMAPPWIVEKAIKIAEEAEKLHLRAESKKNPDSLKIRIEAMIDFLGKYNIEEKAIENYIGKKLKKINEDDLVKLRATATAIKEDPRLVQTIFAPTEVEEEKQSTKIAPAVPEGTKEEIEEEYVKMTDRQRQRIDMYGTVFEMSSAEVEQLIQRVAEHLSVASDDLQVYNQLDTKRNFSKALETMITNN